MKSKMKEPVKSKDRETPGVSFKDVSIEAVKSFWNRRPCNIRHSNQPVGSREYFDEVEKRKYIVEGHIPQFAQFEQWKGKRVLEIGCGIGTDTINFARQGALVTAVDVSEQSLSVAKQRAEVFGLADRIQFFCANAEELMAVVGSDKFDLVYSFGVIHHTPHPERVIEQIKQCLNPLTGEFRMMVYSKVSYKLFWIMKERDAWDFSRIDELIALDSEAQTGCPVTYSYTADSVKELLAGFQISEVRKAHIFTWDIPSYVKHEYKKDPAWAKVSDDELAQLEKELGWHLLVRAKLS